MYQKNAYERRTYAETGTYKSSNAVKMDDEQLCKLFTQFIEIWVNKHFQYIFLISSCNNTNHNQASAR